MCEVGDKAGMIASPDAVDGFAENALARQDIEGEPSVRRKSNENVVNSTERPVAKWPHALYHAVLHQRIARSESVAGVAWMGTLPGISITDAHSA